MVTCYCGLLPNPARIQIIKNKAWVYSIDQKFHTNDGPTQESHFRAPQSSRVTTTARGVWAQKLSLYLKILESMIYNQKCALQFR
jgi:hypothetical protein